VSTVRGGSCDGECRYMPLVVVQDIEMYYESQGSGAPLVVIGGLGLEMSEMDTLINPLASRFRSWRSTIVALAAPRNRVDRIR
jgi:hypothetical protein